MTALVSVLWKDTTDITGAIDWTSVDSISVLTKERGTFQFQVLSTHAAQTPALGDDVKLSDPSGVIFGGTVTEVETTVRKQQGGVLLQSQVTVTDYGFALDSKLVKTSFQDADPADILAALVTQYGPGGYDVTTHVQRAGFTIKTISFNYEQLTKCIEALAQQIGWDWYIDPDKKVHFFFATTETGSSEYNPAPIVVDDTSGGLQWSTLDIDVSIRNLKNSVFVIGGSYAKEYTAANAIDHYTTVAGTTVYPLAYRYTGSFFVTYDGAQQSIGIDQQSDPASYETLYNGTGPFIRFTSDPGSGHTLKVYGFAQVPIVAHMKDDASITTYGEFQDSINDPQIASVQEAQARATADMVLYGHPVYDVKFSTITTGLRVGQVLVLNSSRFGVSNYSVVIKRIEAVQFTPNKLKYQVEAVGSDVVSFNDVMIGLLQQQNANNLVDPSTVIEAFQDAGNENLTLVDTVAGSGAAHNAFKWASTGTPSNWGFALWQ